jgi:putative zinc finger/helix-turn-helix YgiT family protein
MKNASKRNNRNTILPPHCPGCGEASPWSRVKVPQTQEFRGEALEVTAPLRRCSSCGFSLLTTEDATALTQATVATWQEKHGLLTASDMTQRRKKLGLSQKGLSEVSRLGSASIKRWESGLVAQTEAHDTVLRRCLATTGDEDATLIIFHYAGQMEEYTSRYNWETAAPRQQHEDWICNIPIGKTAREGLLVTA